jgi:hypothetical protein
MAELVCEVCSENPAGAGDILCGDCSRAGAGPAGLSTALYLLRRYPKLAREDFAKFQRLFEWRMKRQQEWMNKHFSNPTAKVAVQQK